ncbi:MAG TPA: hypothetical protein PKM84_01720 [Candidatus Pacearchaeota archaeon]|nr:hypothetical protein [Candidatus Pacearchaeota archaeon]
MTSLLDRAKNLLTKSQTILIVPANPFEQESYEASLELARILRNNGKIVNLSERKAPDSLPIFPAPLQKTSLLIELGKNELKELFYEKQGSKLKIDLFFPSGTVDLEDIEITADTQKAEADTIVTIGVTTLASLEEELDENFKLFYEKPIINIDNHQNNDGYGQINLLDKNKALAEIIKLLADEPSVKPAEKLPPAQKPAMEMKKIGETGNFSSQKEKFALAAQTNSTPFHTTAEASPEEIRRTKLLSKALEKIDPQNQLFPVFHLHCEDFLATGAQEKDLAFVIEQIKNSPYTKISSFAFLWDSPSCGDSAALVYSENQAILSNIKQIFKGEQKGKAVMFPFSPQNAQIIKQKLTSLI